MSLPPVPEIPPELRAYTPEEAAALARIFTVQARRARILARLLVMCLGLLAGLLFGRLVVWR